MNPNPQIEAAPAILVSAGPPRWRTTILSILQLIGVLLAILAGGEILGLASVLSPELAKKLALIGPALLFGAKPVITLIGDYLDDGTKNDSFNLDGAKPKDDPNQMKLLVMPIVAMLCLTLSSCAFHVNPDGSKDATVDAKTAVKVLQIIAEK